MRSTTCDHKHPAKTTVTHQRFFFFCFQLMKIMVKVSDISNEARPMAVAEPWLDCLLQEFFNQVFTLTLLIDTGSDRKRRDGEGPAVSRRI